MLYPSSHLQGLRESRHLLVFRNPCPMSPKSCFSSQLPGSPTVSQFLQYLTSLTSQTSPTLKAPPTTRPRLLLSQATFLQVGWATATYKRPFRKPLLHLRTPPPLASTAQLTLPTKDHPGPAHSQTPPPSSQSNSIFQLGPHSSPSPSSLLNPVFSIHTLAMILSRPLGLSNFVSAWLLPLSRSYPVSSDLSFDCMPCLAQSGSLSPHASSSAVVPTHLAPKSHPVSTAPHNFVV